MTSINVLTVMSIVGSFFIMAYNERYGKYTTIKNLPLD